MTLAIDRSRVSPNHGPRPAVVAVDVLVLHYTEMPLGPSLDVLTDPARAVPVSSHYVVAEDGLVFALVSEERVAWHAGRSRWRGREGLNASSIGIEIVNLHGDRHDYPDRQIAALEALCRDILARHPAIAPRNVVGHSDIAPRRKIDPGLRFPWRRLAAAGIGLWPREAVASRAGAPDIAAPGIAAPDEATMGRLLSRFGYGGPHAYPGPDGGPVAVGTADVIAAFQRRFRPVRVDGTADRETLAALLDLLDQVGDMP